MSADTVLSEIPVAHAAPLRRAGFWRRFLALAVDGLIVTIPVVVIGFLSIQIFPDGLLGASFEAAAVYLTLIGNVVLIIYIVGLEWATGSTISNDVTRIHVVDVRDAGRSAPSFLRVCLRALCFFAIAYPVIKVHVTANGVDMATLASRAGASPLQYAAALLFLILNLWILVDIVRKRDPIYDRLAGTAVVIK